MSILNNNKKGDGKKSGNTKNNNMAGGSKFIKSTSKAPNVAKKVRSTGANRGS